MDEDDPNQNVNPTFDGAQMPMGGQHQYPHSHHGTPAAEYPGFVWHTSQMAGDTRSYQRPNHPSLHPLVLPQWPSMLSSQSTQPVPAYYPQVMPQGQLGTTSPTPLLTPISASSTRSGSTPRRTLTDDERRKMCEYHEQNPSAKQNEIGSMFGVERSTVSKVLRQKEKYLQKYTEAVVRSPERRLKGRSPDIERTLSSWVTKEQKKGTILSDEAIREKAQYFSSVSGPDSAMVNPASNPAWLTSFKRKHNIPDRRPSREMSISDNPHTGKKSTSSHHSPSGISPGSMRNDASPSPSGLRGVRSDESLNAEVSDGFSDLTTTLSGSSLHVTEASASISPKSLMSPSSPFFSTSESFFGQIDKTAMSPTTTGDGMQRPRSQTFPMIYQDLSSPSAGLAGSGSDFMDNEVLGASMDGIAQALDSIDEHMGESPGTDMHMNVMQQSQQQQQQQHHVSSSHSQAMRSPPSSSSALDLSTPPSLSHDAFVAAREGAGGQGPSQEDARQALKVVWQYFANQPRGTDENLSMEETAMMGRFMEKLKERYR
ncbi:hypothetical protein AAFC00_004664 [Neodothiora populina]|uniref:HTH CENPB-type domain-containing protein n=1 Tax=Neodothiora populina TaxID=2781224 RepID=A0ABR3P334_9PEZI